MVNYFACVFLLLYLSLVSAKRCPGKCTSSGYCKKQGGKVIGYCTSELACCDLSVEIVKTCGDGKYGLQTAIFQSPNYPKYSSGEITCPFRFGLPTSKSYDGILVEYLDVVTEGIGFSKNQITSCQIDMIFLRGFHNWQPPPRCGNLTGYAVVIERSSDPKAPNYLNFLTVVSMMSSNKWRWKIKITVLDSNAGKSVQHDKSMLNPVVRSVNARIATATGKVSINKEESLIEVENNENNNGFEGIEEPLVVNGEDTNVTEFPWQASLRRFYPIDVLKQMNTIQNHTTFYNAYAQNCSTEGGLFCGGTIISDQFILTNAHCISPTSKMSGWAPIDEIKVFVGDTDQCQDDFKKYGRSPQNFTIDKIIFHYGFDPLHTGLNDIMLLKLKGKIKFSNYIKPVTLSKRKKSYSGKSASLSGWGRTSLTDFGKEFPKILQSAKNISIPNRLYCDHLLEQFYAERKLVLESYPKYRGAFKSVFCTNGSSSTSTKNVAEGDSGGGLIVYEPYIGDASKSYAVQVGIVGFAVQDHKIPGSVADQFVDFYQDIAFHRDWIDTAMLA